MLKVFQYSFVVISEYDLLRHLFRLNRAHEKVQDWKLRTKKLGSAISTARMSLRLGSWLENIKYFIETFRKWQ